MNKEQIIHNMCQTWRHDYNFEITEEEKKHFLQAGMTKQEREFLYRNMKQIFENDILPVFRKHGIEL
jgi:putative sterol carrier protein